MASSRMLATGSPGMSDMIEIVSCTDSTKYEP
jgi:hypothetical protein